MKRICKINGVVLQPNKAWINKEGFQEPAKAWTNYSDEELELRGVEVIYPEVVERRTYWDWTDLEDKLSFEEDGITKAEIIKLVINETK